MTMFVLLESTDQGFINELHESLQAYGITCRIYEKGRDADGNRHFALQLPIHSQIERARRLLFHSADFSRSLHAEFLPALQQIREVPRQQLVRWLTSTWALRLIALCLAAILLGLLGDTLFKQPTHLTDKQQGQSAAPPSPEAR
jgi:hypothetical protein